MGGVLGIGGGLIAIPALVLLMDMPQQLAQGTALIMVLPTIMMAVRKYNQQVRIDKRVAAAGAAGAVVFTWFGARLALGIDSQPAAELRGVPVLHRAVLCMADLARLAADGGARCRQEHAQGSEQERKQGGFAADRRACLHAAPRQRVGMCGTLGGFSASAARCWPCPSSPRCSAADHRAGAGPEHGDTRLHHRAHHVHLAGQANWMGAPLAVGSLAFVPVGVRLAYRLPERRLRACFALMLFATVALLAFEA